jgi:hypothetical protein
MATQYVNYPPIGGSAPVAFNRDGATQTVIEDTGTPSNNRPLVVKLLDTSGNVNTVTVGSSTLPTGAATEATLSALNGKFGSLGQKTMAGSVPVVLASDQSAHPVTQSGTWNITNVSGTVSLPTGASTEATLSTASGTLTTISGKLPATLGQKAMTASMAVVLASDQSAIPVSQSGTWNITNISGTISLPTGAATETTLAAMSAKLPSTLGTKTSANSLGVVLASDQAALSVSQSGTWSVRAQDGSGNALTSLSLGSNRGLHVSALGKTAADKARNDYGSTSVTTSAYVQLKASLAAECQEVEIFDSSGQTLVLATGAAASEVDQIYITPGGNGRIPLRIASGTRVSIKAVSATASVGEIDVNFYG